MGKLPNEFYEFGPFRVDVMERLLLRQGERIPLTPKAFDTLLILVERHGHIVEKNELMRLVWPDAAVEENNLNQNISAIRRALGGNSHEQHFIETLPRRGYRFIAEVRARSHEEAVPQLAPPLASSSTPPLAPPAGIESFPVPAVPAPPRRIFRVGLFTTLALAVLASIGYFAGKQREPTPPDPPSPVNINRLSATSGAWDTALSPDGKLVAFVVGDVSHQSLRVKQIDTATDTELLARDEMRFRGLTFAPDGKSLYYGQQEKNAPGFTLYQKPLQGGEGKRLLADVSSPVTFSPDGKQIAFVRESESKGESVLVIANADGTAQRTLSRRKMPRYYAVEGPSWSPDGKLVAVAAATDEPKFHFQIVTVRVEMGEEIPVGQQQWDWAAKIAWINSQKLVLIGRRGAGNNNHLWLIEYPSGQSRQLLTTLNDYRSLSLSQDGKTLVTVQSELRSDLWLLPEADANRARSITMDSASQIGSGGLDWTPDGRIIYTSLASGHKNLWIIHADGTQAKPLTTEAQDNADRPSVSADGQQVIFNSGRSGFPRVWRIDVNGKSPTELTHGSLDLNPFCSPTEAFVYFSQRIADKRLLHRVRTDGREPPQALTDKLTDFPAVSPDGKFVACIYQETPESKPEVAVLPASGGAPTQCLDLPVFPFSSLRWHPDGQSLTYLTSKDGAMNLWRQRLSGGAPEQLTQFKSDRIFAYSWARDGHMLACARGAINRDVVMIREFWN
jgi:Tol biopolymer transport system component/DNA-binding winged helix-turn-helix (wHTH) protein